MLPSPLPCRQLGVKSYSVNDGHIHSLFFIAFVLAKTWAVLRDSALSQSRAQRSTNTYTMQIRNSVQLIGNLGNDPEQYNSKEGNPFVKFSLATNDYYKDKDGNRQTRTEWHTVLAFGKKAEYVMESLKKGSQVAINGVLRYRTWTDKHEQKRTDANIYLEQYTKLTSDDGKA